MHFQISLTHDAPSAFDAELRYKETQYSKVKESDPPSLHRAPLLLLSGRPFLYSHIWASELKFSRAVENVNHRGHSR